MPMARWYADHEALPPDALRVGRVTCCQLMDDKVGVGMLVLARPCAGFSSAVQEEEVADRGDVVGPSPNSSTGGQDTAMPACAWQIVVSCCACVVGSMAVSAGASHPLSCVRGVVVEFMVCEVSCVVVCAKANAGM